MLTMMMIDDDAQLFCWCSVDRHTNITRKSFIKIRAPIFLAWKMHVSYISYLLRGTQTFLTTSNKLYKLPSIPLVPLLFTRRRRRRRSRTIHSSVVSPPPSSVFALLCEIKRSERSKVFRTLSIK